MKPNQTLQNIFFAISFIICIQVHSLASELEYPELVVAPRATERVQMEANHEYRTRWSRHIPVQLSSLALLSAALMHSSKDTTGSYIRLGGIFVSATWLINTLVLSAVYTPYLDAYRRVKELPQNTAREKLIRERTAESAIDEAGSLGSKIMWFSFISNFPLSVYFLTSAENMAFPIVATVASFAPLFFQYRWQLVSSEQKDYKKRIYGPIASTFVTPPVHSKDKGSAGVLLSFIF